MSVMRLKQPLIITMVIAAGLIALAAGVAVKHYSTSSVQVTFDDLKLFEKHFEPLNSNTVSLESLKGKRVLLNFWGSWCPPCIEEMPMLDAFDKTHSDKVRVIGVAVDRQRPAAEFLSTNNIQFPSIIADIRVISEMLERLGGSDGVLPYSVAFFASGDVMFTKLGPVSEQDLSMLLE